MKKNRLKELKILYQLIAAEQQEDGSFLSRSYQPGKPLKYKEYKTTFFSALILSAISSATDPHIIRVKEKLANFLKKQFSEDYSLNYWARDSKEYTKLPYPDDLDDTFLGLSALYKYDPKLISGKVLAAVLKVLNQSEIKTGGPYRTWINTGHETATTVDLAVNCNIAYFLKLNGIVLPNLSALFEKAILMNQYHSKYYPNIFVIFFYLSRCYDGRLKDKLIKAIQQNINSKTALLDLIFAELAIRNLNLKQKYVNIFLDRAVLLKEVESLAYPLPSDINSHPDLIKILTTDSKAFKAEPVCYDPKLKGKVQVAGCRALTASLFTSLFYPNSAQNNDVNPEEVFKVKLIKSAKRQIEYAPTNLKARASKCLQKTLEADIHSEIIFLNYYFNISIKKKSSENLIENLSLVTLFGWMAFSIYDDCVDQKLSKDLPIADFFLNQMRSIAQNISGAEQLLNGLLQTMDRANQEEKKTHAKIQSKSINFSNTYSINYKTLAEKSIGHAFGPLYLTRLITSAQNSSGFRHLYNFFLHYLAAKQITDDAHDWQEDLQVGHITEVVSRLLKDVKIFEIISLQKIPELSKIFWNRTMKTVAGTILAHLETAESELRKCKIVQKNELLLKLLEPLRNSANLAISESQRVQDFLKSYT